MLSHCRYFDRTFYKFLLSSPPPSIKKLYKFLILICCHDNWKSKVLNSAFIAVHSGGHCGPWASFLNLIISIIPVNYMLTCICSTCDYSKTHVLIPHLSIWGMINVTSTIVNYEDLFSSIAIICSRRKMQHRESKKHYCKSLCHTRRILEWKWFINILGDRWNIWNILSLWKIRFVTRGTSGKYFEKRGLDAFLRKCWFEATIMGANSAFGKKKNCMLWNDFFKEGLLFCLPLNQARLIWVWAFWSFVQDHHKSLCLKVGRNTKTKNQQ